MHSWVWFGLPWIVLAVLFWWAGRRPVFRARKILKEWNTTPATITFSKKMAFDSALVPRGKSGFAFESGPGGDGPGAAKWLAQIRYEHSVAGVRIESDRVTLHVESREREVEQLVATFPVGARVFARVNPNDPHDVVLAPEWSLHPAPVNLVPLVIMGVVGVGTIVMGLSGLVTS